MKRSSVVALLGIAMISLLGLLVWLVGQGIFAPGGAVEARHAESGGSSTAASGHPSAGEQPAVHDPRDGDRRALQSLGSEKTAPEVVLAGRCVDETGAALNGVEVELTTAEGTLSTALDLYRFQHPDMLWDDPPIRVHSGEDGRFQLRLRTPQVFRGWRLNLRTEGRVPLEAYFNEFAAGHHDLGDLQLRPGCVLVGAVRDRKGRPHDGVRVLFSRDVDWAKGDVEQNSLALRTSADGTFHALEAVAPAKWRVSVHGAQVPEEQPLLVDLTGKTSHHLQILVRDFEEVDTVSGWVLDDAGRPLVPSWVHFEPTGDYPLTHWAECDTNGRFQVQRRPRDPGGRITLVVTGNDRPAHRVPGIAWNTTDLRIEVPALPELELIVVEVGDGHPLEHYGVIHQEACAGLGFGNLKPIGHLQRHPQGRVRIGCLTRGRHRFTVVPRDPTLSWSEPREVEVGEQPLAPLVVEVPRRGARPVVVVDAAGKGIGGVKLQLLRPCHVDGGERLFVIDPLETSGASSPSLALVEQESVTDSHGCQALHGNPTHRYALRVLPSSHLPRLIWDVIPNGRFGELRIVLDEGCSVQCRVEPLEQWQRLCSQRPPTGDGQEDPEVGFSVTSLAPGALRRVSPLVQPDATGRFQISGLPPGAAELSMRWYRRDGEDLDPMVTTVQRWEELPAERPADVVVDLRRFQPIQLSGLATHNGRPLPEARILVSITQEVGGIPRGIAGLQVKTGAGGLFACEGLTGAWTARWSGLVARAGPITTDTRAVEFAFHSGGLAVVVRRENGTPVSGVTIHHSLKGPVPLSRMQTHDLPRSDAQGRASVSCIAPGDYELWTWPRSMETEEARRRAFGADAQAALAARIPLGNAKVVLGETVEARVTLPATAGY